MAVTTSTSITVTLKAPTEPFKRADLEFHGIDHSKASFEGRIFINKPDAGPDTPKSDGSYVGSFWVFGHGGCAGDEGHCEPPSSRRAFDLRPEYQLTPMSMRVIVTDGIRELTTPGEAFEVTVVPSVRTASVEALPANLVTDLLRFDRIDLLTFQ